MYARPPYPYRHSGNCLVLGTAPNALDDLEAALELLGGTADLMGINEAGAIAYVDHLVTMHPERMGRFLERCARRPITHAAINLRPGTVFRDYPDVDHFWGGAHSGATSAWTGVRIAKGMGFDRVILCGCPMTAGDGYGVKTDRGSKDDPRFGLLAADAPLVKSYQEVLKRYAAEEGKNVYSMSGFTRAILGAPPEDHNGK